MKKFLIASTLGLMASSHALADAGAELAKAKNCLACHTVDKKVVGPAYKDIASKYKAEKGADAKLADKIKKGGSGVWGNVPMPPNPQVNEAEAKQLAQWILGLK